MIPLCFISACVCVCHEHAQVCVRRIKPSPFILPPPGQHRFFTCEFTRLHLHVEHEFILFRGFLSRSFKSASLLLFWLLLVPMVTNSAMLRL